MERLLSSLNNFQLIEEHYNYDEEDPKFAETKNLIAKLAENLAKEYPTTVPVKALSLTANRLVRLQKLPYKKEYITAVKDLLSVHTKNVQSSRYEILPQ